MGTKVGKTKYLPPVSKEWKNSVYNYYSRHNIDFPVTDLKINSLIKGYFGLYFHHQFAEHKYISRKKKRKSFLKILVSKAEIKHTNNKAIVTIYVFNKERSVLWRKIRNSSVDILNWVIGLQKEYKDDPAKFLSSPLIKTEARGGTKDPRGSSEGSRVVLHPELPKQPTPTALHVRRLLAKDTTCLPSPGLLWIQSDSTSMFSKFLSFTIPDLEEMRHIYFRWFTLSAKNHASLRIEKDITRSNQWKSSTFRLHVRLRRVYAKIQRVFSVMRRFALKLTLNRWKFSEIFLNKLIKFISRYYGKKVEFNIVNLKSLASNTDIFTDILTSKLKKEKTPPMRRIDSLLSRVVLPKVNRIIERGRIEKEVNLALIENKYRNLHLSSLINKASLQEWREEWWSSDFEGPVSGVDHPVERTESLPSQLATPSLAATGSLATYKDNLNKLLYNIYYKSNSSSVGASKIHEYAKSCRVSSDKGLAHAGASEAYEFYSWKLRDIILDEIKYKSMAGAKVIVKGRLTRRYRADRALFKYKWKGGLKNIDSAFKGLSTVIFRGFRDSNVDSSRSASKRRIGSFGVRTWIAGK